MNRNTIAASVVVLCLLTVGVVVGQKAAAPDREKVRKTMQSGNWREAYDGFSKLALDPQSDARLVGEDLKSAVQCLQRLGRASEIDAFREKVIGTHAKNWRLLQAAAETYLQGEHYGFIIAGNFERGSHRGGGKMVSSAERDRIRSMQLMVQAMGAVADETDKKAAGTFYIRFADMVMSGVDGNQSWRLQELSDLTKLPDYEEGYYGRYYRGYARGGAPVDDAGKPVFYSLPKAWDGARNDGERWRWLLVQAMELDPARAGEVRFKYASFMHQQFGVQTMAYYGYGRMFGRAADDSKKDESGPYAVSTLKETETIARLATGIKRFDLPDEHNYIKLFKQIADENPGHWGEQSLAALGQSYEDRQQYPTAATVWARCAKEYPKNQQAPERFSQITGNWGMFESIGTQPAGKDPSFEFRFRNGKQVSFEAYEIDYRKLLDDVKAYLKSNPPQLSWEKVAIDQIGYQLVQGKAGQYIGKQVAQWNVELKPYDKHFDRRLTVTAPLKKAGAYWVKARMADGNLSHVVLWVNDSIMVKKAIDGGSYYFLADATSGEPVAKATVEYFGYEQRHIKDRQFQVLTTQFAENTDADGQVILKDKDPNQRMSWLITATDDSGRLATIGFSHIWQPRYPEYDYFYNQIKVFGITDRPVYRPGNTVKFKSWMARSQYDQLGKSPFAGQSFVVEIHNPKGDKIYTKGFTLDEYGGCDGELAMPKDATLGSYAVQCFYNGQVQGSFAFRLEEYKKPEFEVKVDAPAEPVMLGDKIEATISAKYYFGATVTDAKVKYKVTRDRYTIDWFPVGRWDWMYGQGYWWFASDYLWYPGFKEWGCFRPIPFWWHGRSFTPPEVVSEREVPIGPDGTVKVEIDTGIAKAMHGDFDHQYTVTAEITDQSRRTIVGSGNVIAARKPFKVYAWVHRGHYRSGDVVEASFKAQTPDRKPVQGKGDLRLIKVSYDKDMKPVETEVGKWALDTDAQGEARQQMKAAQPGQYRLSYKVTDAKKHEIEGGYVFVVRGDNFDGKEYRFNDIELVSDKREYREGDKAEVMINTNKANATVALFLRPANGVYLPPKIIRLKGKSTTEAVEIVKKDMPNIFVEAFTISDGKFYTETRELVVPPESRILKTEVITSKTTYKPGEKSKVQIKLTDPSGEPFVGSTVIAVYDKAVEYISGGSNVPDIKEFFWKWRRQHYPRSELSSAKGSSNLVKPGDRGMSNLGVFGHMVADLMRNREAEVAEGGDRQDALAELAATPPAPSAAAGPGGGFGGGMARMRGAAADANGVEFQSAAKSAPADEMYFAERKAKGMADGKPGDGGGAAPGVEPTVRKNFADTAFWAAAVETNKNGVADVEWQMPEQLTTWKAKVWAMGAGTQVGSGDVDLITTKDLIVRLQAPRFFVQKDEVVLSANVHNYLKTKKTVKVSLELDGKCLKLLAVHGANNAGPEIPNTLDVDVEPKGEKRVDFLVKVVQQGEAVVRMKAVTDEDSDAVQMTFPAYVHGMLKTDSYAGAIRPEGNSGALTFNVPAERNPAYSRLEVRYSPTLAMAMVDALPYLAEYPYGCTEQTLNRFVPTVITQKVLLDMKLDLADIRAKRTNLNAQEIGNDPDRAKQWKRFDRNPVFDPAEVADMVKAGVATLAAQQLTDGGWGWFSGWGERSYPHTTATVVHGLQVAKVNDAALIPGMLERGVQWLKNYQAGELRKLKNAATKTIPWKEKADNLDALTYMVLVDAAQDSREMRDFLYRDRNDLSVYAKAMVALACHRVNDFEKMEMLVRNVDQYLVKDNENQTCYLKMPEGNVWWYWWASDTEAMAYYLKLLALTEPKGDKAAGLAKYLVNNRKNATYWASTRDTALVIEGLADFIRASGEDKPEMTVEILVDGKKKKDVSISAANLFIYDNKLVMTGDELTAGAHKVEFRKTGKGPLYFNAYATNFTMEDNITKAGLEIKIERAYYKLVPVDKKISVSGSSGQALKQKVEKYDRVPLKDGDTLKSGDLVEAELVIESKNDYEYLIFEDMKAAGFEPVEVRSGYTNNDLRAYVEFRDERVCFFARTLARGKHSVNYRLRSEIPGKFSALPAKASAMYAPELKANSDEIKLRIKD